ncbi:PA2779 family protein [Rhodoferax sp.]|uniref:PA2779 family protein n=1 Tax=Rhodoferax sp. TaxID=50421 RepID=UPI002632CAF7|nr:PA2779 family protein [Rhodoferax sp.]MDD2918889.1 PA2779 family protein [Rhodoferax sp.]
MKSFKKFVSTGLIVCITAAGLPFSAQARIVATEEITAPAAASTLNDSRATVNQFLARDEVRQAMLGQGVTSQAALERVAAMSDSEVAQLAGRIDQAPAGGDVLGILFTVFIVLLITDIMGLTKVFPFTRSVR